MKVHPRDNDLVIATHARGFYILDDATPLQQLAKASSVTLFPPMRATRYTPASDTSVLGNRVWVARNRPYGIINYYLPDASTAAPTVTIADRSGRIVRMLPGTGRAGLNRVVWNLAEASPCGSSTARRGRGGDGASWIRALPGDYVVRLTALGRTVEQPLAVRLDPRVTATSEDLAVYDREVRKIQSIDCSTSEALGRIAAIDAQLAGVERSAAAPLKTSAQAIRRELHEVAADFGGDPREPERLNLRGKMNWLTIQVGNYTGRPTPAQMEWIGRFGADRDRLVGQLDAIVNERLASLNARLRSAGLSEIREMPR